MLYSGYTLWAVPFAFAIGALVVRRVDADWIRATRRFALAAWFFLGVGILLGARWSYAELGWGGYWAWDPVENASLLPWLTGTAFLHSVMVQEKRGMLKVWNVSLILATGTLAVLGTFLVRSGILDSIHAFGASTLGVPFVSLIAVMIAGSVYLVVSRRAALRSEHRLDSLLSREAAFLGNNLVLVGLAFVVFWGTFFPLISEAVTGTKAAVGPPWFNRYTVPLALVLVLLSGIGPVIAWRRATLANARRNFLWPTAVALVTLVALLALRRDRQRHGAIMFVFAAFVVGVARPGAVARGERAARDDLGRARARAREPRAPQPPALRRLHRPPRHGRALRRGRRLVGLPARPRRAPDARAARRPSAATRSPTSSPPRAWSTATAASSGSRSARCSTCARTAARSRALHTERGYYPSAAPFASGGLVRGLFEGEATSEVGMKAGPLRDVWTVIQPDPEYLSKVIAGVADRTADKPVAQQERAVSGLIGVYERRRRPGPVPPARLAPGGLDLARRADRLRRRADRAVAGTRRGPRPGAGRLRRARGAGPGPRVGARRGGRPGPADRHRAARRRRLAGQRAAAHRRGRGRRGARARAATSSRRPRRPSTARSATPSSTTAPASCPRRTGARWIASCAREAIEPARRWTSWATRAGTLGTAHDGHDLSSSSRSSSASS